MEANYLTYNRDLNISGSITAYEAMPEYGTSVDFEFLDFSFYTQDNHGRYSEKELNNFLLDFNLKFTQQTEDQAKSLVSFLEKVSTGVSGAETMFNFGETNSDGVSIQFPTGAIYKNISGLLVDSYDVNFHNGLFDIDLKLKTNLHSPYLSWKNSTFLNAENVKTYDVRNRTEYEKFDVIYISHTGLFVDGISSGMSNGLYKIQSQDASGNKIYQHVEFNSLHAYNHPTSGKWVLGSGQTITEDASSNTSAVGGGTAFFIENDSTKRKHIEDVLSWSGVFNLDQLKVTDRSHLFFDKRLDKTKRHFYLSETGAVPSAVSPPSYPRFAELISEITGNNPDSFIHDDFIFEPDDNISIDFKNTTNVLKFDSSIQEAQNLSKNKNIIEDLSLTFSNRSDKETFALLHFLEKNRPPTFFKFKLPKLFNKDKFFKVLLFSHNFIYKDCNTIDVSFQEVIEPQKKEFLQGESFTLCIEQGTDAEGANYGLIPSIATEDFQKISLEYKHSSAGIKQRPTNVFDESKAILDSKKAIEFQLNWENIGTTSDEGFDLDIHVTDPNGTLYNYSNVSFGTNNPGFVKDNRGEDFASIGDVGGPENLFWRDNESAVRGTYEYQVQMFNKNTSSTVCAWTVDVYVSGVIQQTNSGSFSSSQNFDASSSTFTYTLV